MDSGWAVVIGALVAFAGTILGPYLLEERKRKSEARSARRSELAELIPAIFESYAHPSTDDTRQAETGMVTRLQLLVDKEAWSVALIVTLVGAQAYRTPELIASAVDVITAWFRGSIESSEVLSAFHEKTGIEITGVPWKSTQE